MGIWFPIWLFWLISIFLVVVVLRRPSPKWKYENTDLIIFYATGKREISTIASEEPSMIDEIWYDTKHKTPPKILYSPHRRPQQYLQLQRLFLISSSCPDATAAVAAKAYHQPAVPHVLLISFLLRKAVSISRPTRTRYFRCAGKSPKNLAVARYTLSLVSTYNSS